MVTEKQKQRLRELAQPHAGKGEWQREMDGLVGVALDRLGELYSQGENATEAFQRELDDNRNLRIRVTKLKAELESIAIALEWPGQDEVGTLLDAVKEAACNGVLLCEARGKLARIEFAAREVVFKPVGKRRATCNSDALMELESLLPDDMAVG